MNKYTIMPFSAHCEQALYGVIEKFIAHIRRNSYRSLHDIAFSYQTGKIHHQCRVAFICYDLDNLQDQCEQFLSKKLWSSNKIIASSGIVFLFSGQGTQYAGMGAELYKESKIFRDALDRCAVILNKLLPKNLKDILFDLTHKDFINNTNITQPVLFALEYALAQQWIAWGFKPSLLLGHSLGEWVAACIGGAYTVEHACELVFHRGALMQKLCEPGSMASVASSAAHIESIIKEYEVVISAYNSVGNVVIGGPHKQLKACINKLEKQGIRCKELLVSHAFHTPLVEPMIQSFQKIVEKVPVSLLDIPLISSLDGVQRTRFESNYWSRQISEPTRFINALETLDHNNANIIIEIGPQPVLSKLAKLSLSQDQVIINSLSHNRHNCESLYYNLSKIWCAGIELNWRDFYSVMPKRIHLPPYAYQRKEYNLDALESPRKEVIQPGKIFNLSEVTEKLLALWHELLGPAEITSTTNFTMLGADSLAAVQLLAQTKQIFDVPLSLAEMYKEQTLGLIAELIYSKIKKSNSNTSRAKRKFIKSVHIIGAHSFLGAHVLKEIYDSTAALITCTSHQQVIKTLTFYFGQNFVELSASRISKEQDLSADIIFDLSTPNSCLTHNKKGSTATYHVGELIGHYVTGHMDQDIFSSRFYTHLRNINTYEYAPHMSSLLNLIPVDYAASALVELAQLENCPRTMFHILNPHPVESSEIYDSMHRAELIIGKKSEAPSYIPVDFMSPCEQTRRLTENAGVYCPRLDTEFLLRIMNYCSHIGFLCKTPHKKINFLTPPQSSTDMSALI